MKKLLIIPILLVALFLTGFVLINYYSFIFAKTVTGKLIGVERVSAPVMLSGDVSKEQLFSYAIAIKTANGEIYTASSEDRQWAVAKPDMCAEAKFYPYPFWQLDKAGTYYNARLVKLKECQ